MKIKICGIKSEAEARAVLACEYRGRHVDFLGVIFAKSVRLVSQETARKIAQIAHENGAKIVGVFGEQNDSEICEIAKFCDLDIVQIYRQTDATFMQNLATIRAGNLQTNLTSNLDKNFTQNFSQENHAKISGQNFIASSILCAPIPPAIPNLKSKFFNNPKSKLRPFPPKFAPL